MRKAVSVVFDAGRGLTDGNSFMLRHSKETAGLLMHLDKYASTDTEGLKIFVSNPICNDGNQ